MKHKGLYYLSQMGKYIGNLQYSVIKTLFIAFPENSSIEGNKYYIYTSPLYMFRASIHIQGVYTSPLYMFRSSKIRIHVKTIVTTVIG